jgi:hypothetical protein
VYVCVPPGLTLNRSAFSKGEPLRAESYANLMTVTLFQKYISKLTKHRHRNTCSSFQLCDIKCGAERLKNWIPEIDKITSKNSLGVKHKEEERIGRFQNTWPNSRLEFLWAGNLHTTKIGFTNSAYNCWILCTWVTTHILLDNACEVRLI